MGAFPRGVFLIVIVIVIVIVILIGRFGSTNIEHSTLNVEVGDAESCGLRRFIAALLPV